MAAPYNPPKKNEDFIFYIALADMNVPGSVKSSPTIASGDFKVSKDGGSFNNLGTLPSVEPSGTASVKVTLSNTEMNADTVFVLWVDQTDPKEWADDWHCIVTTA